MFFQRTVGDHREDVIDLFPGVFMTVKMIPDSTGRWLLHCHVNDHMVNGMEALYDVIDGMFQCHVRFISLPDLVVLRAVCWVRGKGAAEIGIRWP